MASTPSFLRNSRALSGHSLHMVARTEAHICLEVMGLSLSVNSSTKVPTAPSWPRFSAKCRPMRTATCSRCRHFFCTSRLRVACSSCNTVPFPWASMKASGIYCTSWKSAAKASNCTCLRCSWLHFCCSVGGSASKHSSKDSTRPQRTATSAHCSEEQHRAKVPHSSVRNSMSSCVLVMGMPFFGAFSSSKSGNTFMSGRSSLRMPLA
mmetsp:Transcript_2726/g.6422  ORF Transcript_2726/g.6422 Transcript_2726/m.6422 type:complete len:208 (+) Transcript_2726:1147-1770(+)